MAHWVSVSLMVFQSNPYEAAGVKRADGGLAGAGWPSEKQRVNRCGQVSAADFISVAGHSL